MTGAELVHAPTGIVLDPDEAPISDTGALQAVLLMLDDRRRDLAAAGDLDQLAAGLAALRDFASNLGQLLADLEADVARLMPDRTVTAEGVGVLQRHPKPAGNPKWDPAAVLADVVRAALIDPSTGALRATTPTTAAEAVARAVYATAPMTPSMQWRVGALRDLGLEPDDYRDRPESKGHTVQITTTSSPRRNPS